MNATQAKLPEGSYWDNHPMLYASNDVSDPWSPKIMTGLNINVINNVAINNGGYVNHAPRSPEPDIVQRFTDNLRQEDGVRQIFQPWRMQYAASGQVTSNRDQLQLPNRQIITDQNSILHRNHLHAGF